VVNCSFFEGFGIPLAEAAVCGKPMAVSEIPVFREIAGSSARYFNPNNSDEIAAVMLESMAPEYQAEMATGREEVLKKIDSATIANKLYDIYQSLR
jgi:glycosyltransferase involved in cell wall biosynthesis